MTHNPVNDIPSSPFSPITPLVLGPVDSDLYAFLEEAHALIQQSPALVEAVERDLDAHALRKKAIRVADAKWLSNRMEPLPGMGEPAQDPDKPLVLMQGRPRTSGYVVLIALVLRGYSGAGFKSADVTSTMAESITLRVFFSNLGIAAPGRSTLTELVNAVSNQTRELVLDAQLSRVLRMKFDTFDVFLQDSTHVGGNTAWPTDSHLMVDIVSRLIRIGEALERVHLSPIDLDGVRKLLQKMAKLSREIDFSRGKRDSNRTRRRRYERLLRMAKRTDSQMAPKVAKLARETKALDVMPSQQAIAERAVARLQADLDALRKVCAACEARVIHETKVPMCKKVLSISDPDAAFIKKGQREPVIGYKPQIARSGAGFITGLRLPQGNAPDSKNLLPMVDQVIARTTVIPKVISVDDGYASQANVDALKQKDRNIEVVSISGAKGRALTSPTDWESELFVQARDKRSAIESLMYTLKQGFHFGEVARRGLLAVHAELLEKALAYNIRLAARLRREPADAAKPDSVPIQAVA